MNTKEAMELHNKSFKVLVGEIFRHYDVEICQEGKDYILVYKYIKGEREKDGYYAIYYKIDNEFFYTISTITAMKKGSSILTTREIVEKEIITRIMQDEEIFISKMEKEKAERMKQFIDFFIAYLSNHHLIKVRVITGNYQWFMQDGGGRRKWK